MTWELILTNRYDSYDSQLLKDRILRREKVIKYSFLELGNQTTEEYMKSRTDYLKQIFGKVNGENIFVEAPFSVDYGYNVEIGDNFYSNFNLTILDCSLVKIGNGVAFGPNVVIVGATHPVDPIERVDNYVEWARKIEIGDKVWIGSNVTILPGVTIGEGTTIGANSVVNKDVPSFCVAVGTPARIVKKLPGFIE